MRLDRIENYDQLRELISKTSWQKFEEVVGKIFELNGYEVRSSKVITFKETKRQYDVLASDENELIAVDCKRWDKKRRKSSGLRQAVKKHINRVGMLNFKKEKYPIIVLSSKTPIRTHQGVPILPIQKLNTFLLHFERNKERILKV